MKTANVIHRIKRLIASMTASVLVAGVMLAAGVILTGCGAKWRTEAKAAYSNARFAPRAEEVVPASLLGSASANAAAAFTPTSAAYSDVMSVSGHSVRVEDTGAAPHIGYVTLEDEINICINRISYANALKQEVLLNIGRLSEPGAWQNGSRLDVAEDGTLEFSQQNPLTQQAAYKVRLSADRTIVEIINYPHIIDNVYSKYDYGQYSSYDGEVYIDMETLDFYKKDSADEYSSMHIGYSEYKKAENGIIHSTLVQFGCKIEYDENGLPTGKKQCDEIDVTAYGGKEDMLYRHWRRISQNSEVVGDLYVSDAEAHMTVQFAELHKAPRYNVFASANLFNIETLYLEEEPSYTDIRNGRVNYRVYPLTGVEFSDGTVIYPEQSEGTHWRGSASYYPGHDIYAAQIGVCNISKEVSMHDALAAFGFVLADSGLDFSSLTDGRALQRIDDIRIGGIEGIEDKEITRENMSILYERLHEFLIEKRA